MFNFFDKEDNNFRGTEFVEAAFIRTSITT